MTDKKNSSVYIPMDGPWQSEEDDKAYGEAVKVYEEKKASHPYVALIQSHHWASHGYWVEIEKREVKYPDHILKSTDQPQ